MQTPQRLVLIESSLVLLLLLAGTTAMVTEARYRQQTRAYDQARAARPAIRISRLTESADLGALQPGTSADFDFSVDNGATDQGISEVGLDYEIAIAFPEKETSQLAFSLYWLDAAELEHFCAPSANGTYPGREALGTEPQTQRYRLRISLPPDAEPGDIYMEHAVQIEVTARQRNA